MKFVDAGEAKAVALAIEKENSLLILDDIKARKLATKLNLKYTGTIGILIDAKQNGYINSMKQILKKISKTNFRLTEELEIIMIKKAGE